MTINQKILRWLREQPLFSALTGGNPLAGVDKERSLTLMVAPILAFVLVVTGGIGVGYAAVSTTDQTAASVTQASELPEQLPSEEEVVEEQPVVQNSLDEAIAAWGEPDLAAILTEAFPGAEWSLNGNSYAGLTWFGPGPKPTEEELLGLWATVGQVLAERRSEAEAEQAREQAEQEAVAQARAADPTRQELCRSIDYKALYGPGIDYTKILSVHYPGAQWSLNGSAYSGLTWISPGAKPTKATLDGLWDGVAFQLCLQKPMSELQARAGTSETEEYVDGALRPKGFSEGTFTPSLANCNQLPQVPHDGGGGEVRIYNDPTGGQNFEQVIGMGLGAFGCRLAEAHGWFGGQYSMGLSVNGERTVMWYSSPVDAGKVRALLSSLGAILTPPAEPEPDPEPEPEAEPDPDTEPESE